MRVLRLATFLPAKVLTFFPINYANTSLYFILLPVIRYNRCRGRSNPVILSGTIFKLLIAVILTYEIVMRKLAMKIGMIPQNRNGLHLCPILLDTQSVYLPYSYSHTLHMYKLDNFVYCLISPDIFISIWVLRRSFIITGQ